MLFREDRIEWCFEALHKHFQKKGDTQADISANISKWLNTSHTELNGETPNSLMKKNMLKPVVSLIKKTLLKIEENNS
jgi:hypothetical protein